MSKGKGLPNGVLIAAIIAVAILATSFSGFKPTAFATEISSCQNINVAGSYQLTANLAPIDACFNITSSNTELDCNNFWINSSGSNTDGAAVNVSPSDSTNVIRNVTVRNCRTQGFYYSVYALSANETNITYNFFFNATGYGSALDSSSNYTTVSNNAYQSGSGSGLILQSGRNLTVRNNTFTDLPSNPIDIRSISATNSTVDILIINNTVNTSGSPLIIQATSNSQNLQNVSILSNAIYSTQILYIYRSNWVTVAYNTINSTGSGTEGIYVDTTPTNVRIHSNVISNVSGNEGIEIQANATIYNNTIYSSGSSGAIFLARNGNLGGAAVYNNTIYNATGPGVYVLGSYANISNNTIESSSTNGIYIDGTFSGRDANITGNVIKYSRSPAIRIARPVVDAPNIAYINENKVCYNSNSLTNNTVKFTMGNNTFCADQLAPSNGTVYSGITAFTANITNSFGTICYLHVNNAVVASNSSVTNNGNMTFVYTPSVSGNWSISCDDSKRNTANSSVFLLSAAAAPPSSGGGDTGGEVKLPPTPPPKVKDFTLSAVNSIIQIFLGKSASNSLLIQNTGEEDLVFSTLTVTGVDTSWLSLPSSLPIVLAGSSAALDIGITVPSDAAPKLYTAHASATASGISKSTSFDVRVEAACDGCFLASLKNNTLTTSKNQPVYNTLTITNVGNVELTAQLSAMGDTRSWVMFSQDGMKIPAGKEATQTIEITPTISEDGIYPVNITISSGAKTQELSMLINLKTVPGCPVCPAPKESGACVNGKQQLTAYTCSEATGLTCQPTAQEVSCALVKKKKLLLPFFEAPIEHLENNLWIVLILAALIIYAGYRYYKKRKADKIKMQQISSFQ